MSISAYLPTCLLGLGLATLAGHAASQRRQVRLRREWQRHRLGDRPGRQLRRRNRQGRLRDKWN